MSLTWCKLNVVIVNNPVQRDDNAVDNDDLFNPFIFDQFAYENHFEQILFFFLLLLSNFTHRRSEE